MAVIPVWQKTVGGNPQTSIGAPGGPYESDFWSSQGIFPTNRRPCIVNYRGDIYLIGCFSRPVFRLAATQLWYPVGIVPPFFPVSLALTGTGSGIAGAVLGYITFCQKVGDRLVQESNPSNVVDAGTMNDEYRLWTNIQNSGAEYHVTHVRGYVSMDGADFRMAWEAPYGVTTITEGTPTARLSFTGPDFENRIPPSGVLYGADFSGRMIYANNAKFPYRLWISKVGQPAYVPTASFLDTMAREPITGIARARNEFIVFCLRNSYLMRSYSTGTNDFVLERLDSNVGCLTHHSIQEIHNRLWFAGEDGMWIYDGGFNYLMADLRTMWLDDYDANRQAFLEGFSGHDRIRKCYLFFTNRLTKPEWENTELNPGTVRYVGYYGNFEPSMVGDTRYPDWSLDFLDRFDTAALYESNARLLVSSADGVIRQQDDSDPDDDGDVLNKALIIRTGHLFMYDPGGDLQSGKKLETLWAHIESESNAWTLYCLGGDEDSWRQIRPDNDIQFWKADEAASALTEARTIDGVTSIYTWCAVSVHFFIPERVIGRGFTFEVRATSPVEMKYRGIGGFWSPGVADRQPLQLEACTYPTLAVNSPLSVTVIIPQGGGGTGSLNLADIDNGSVGVDYWRIELISGGVVVQTYQGTTLAGTFDFDENDVGDYSVRVTAWDRDISQEPSWEPCAARTAIPLTVTGEACTYVAVVLDDTLQVNIPPAQFIQVFANDLDEGSFPAPAYWRLEKLDGPDSGASDEGTNPAAVSLQFDCNEVGFDVTVQVTCWTRDISVEPEWEVCAASATITIQVRDPGGNCP